jgi:hypothetical protein
MNKLERWVAVVGFLCLCWWANAQLNQSGGAGSSVTATQSGTWTVQPGNTANTTAWKVDGSGVTQPVSGTVTSNQGGTWTVQPGNTANTTAWKVDGSSVTQPVSLASIPALAAGTANVGFVRVLPSPCTQSTNFANSTAQVATGAGTTVTSTTTCVTSAYANNITNSAVTLRLADKQGTPVIWLGGNADFSIPANSNIKIPIDGVTFTSGITAIAGTSSAINLQMNGVQ